MSVGVMEDYKLRDLRASHTRACPLPWFHLKQHVNAKRDSIYCKTRQWKYYWLQNATRYVISKWCLLPCYQESIIDCKTRFASFGRIWGVGVPFAYASNVKVNLGSLRNLPFNQFPFNTELLTTSTLRDALDSSSLHPTSPMPPVFVHGHHYVFDSGEWQ